MNGNVPPLAGPGFALVEGGFNVYDSVPGGPVRGGVRKTDFWPVSTIFKIKHVPFPSLCFLKLCSFVQQFLQLLGWSRRASTHGPVLEKPFMLGFSKFSGCSFLPWGFQVFWTFSGFSWFFRESKWLRPSYTCTKTLQASTLFRLDAHAVCRVSAGFSRFFSFPSFLCCPA